MTCGLDHLKNWVQQIKKESQAMCDYLDAAIGIQRLGDSPDVIGSVQVSDEKMETDVSVLSKSIGVSTLENVDESEEIPLADPSVQSLPLDNDILYAEKVSIDCQTSVCDIAVGIESKDAEMPQSGE